MKEKAPPTAGDAMGIAAVLKTAGSITAANLNEEAGCWVVYLADVKVIGETVDRAIAACKAGSGQWTIRTQK